MIHNRNFENAWGKQAMGSRKHSNKSKRVALPSFRLRYLSQ